MNHSSRDSRTGQASINLDERPLPPIPQTTSDVEGIYDSDGAPSLRNLHIRQDSADNEILQEDHDGSVEGQSYEEDLAPNRRRSQSSTNASGISRTKLAPNSPNIPTNAPRPNRYSLSEHDYTTGTPSRHVAPRLAPVTLRPSGRTRNGNSSSDEESIPNFSHNQTDPDRRHGVAETSNPVRPQFTVPRWQPDAEVTLCPICRTQFSFFLRKHHCRKCGRVVCNSCSPHRITIPKEYIVHPPHDAISSNSSSEAEPRPVIDRARAGIMAGTAVLESSEGGESVRLCNPCVPDPNIAPPQIPSLQSYQKASQQGHGNSMSTSFVSRSTPFRIEQPNAEFLTSLANSTQRSHQSSIPVNQSRLSESRDRARGNSYSARDDRTLRPEGTESRSRSSTLGSTRNINNTGPTHASMHYPTRYSNQTTGSRRLATQGPRVYAAGATNAPSVLPRPQLPEEDECWVCHNELPSRLIENWESLREDHVEACITTAMGGGSSQSPEHTATTPSAPISSPFDHTHGSSSAPQPTTMLPIANTPEARMTAREQAHAAVVLGGTAQSPGSSQRRTGVFPYSASEKDCVDDAECTICLEEFEPGVQMGRLECFCRFHLKCIRAWFVTRPGQCPVHQHGGGY